MQYSSEIIALLDTGSTGSIIAEHLINQLALPFVSTERTIVGIGGVVQQLRAKLVNIELTSSLRKPKGNSDLLSVSCWSMPTLTQRLLTPCMKDIARESGIPLDKFSLGNQHGVLSPGLLLGIDVFWDIVGLKQRTLNSGLVLVPSKFGWIVSGPLNMQTTSHVHTVTISELESSIARLWTLESLGLVAQPEESEKLVQNHFLTSVKFSQKDKCYVVLLTFCDPTIAFPMYNNLREVVKRLSSLERRFSRSPDLLDNYRHEI